MRVTRHHRPIVSLLALALVLGAGFLPAAAQSGSEAVVCVGSETRTLQTNPIRRVYTEDMEVVYRIGVDIGQRFSSQNDGSGYEVLLRETWERCGRRRSGGRWAGTQPAGWADLYGKLLSRFMLDGAG